MSDVDPTASGRVKVEASGKQDDGRLRVLLINDGLVGDEPVEGLALLQKIRAAGIDVDLASDGAPALEKLCHRRQDAILMDVTVTSLVGLDLIQTARRHPSFGTRPIYVCTTEAYMSLWEASGPAREVTKVFDRGSTSIEAIVGEIAGTLMRSRDISSPSSLLGEARPERAAGEQIQPAKPKPSQAPELVTASASPLKEPPRCAGEPDKTAVEADIAPAADELKQRSDSQKPLENKLQDRLTVLEEPDQQRGDLTASENGRIAKLTREVARLREARREFEARRLREQQTATEEARRAEEQVVRLSQDLERARSELAAGKEGQERLEAQWRIELKEAKAAAATAEAAWTEEAALAKRLKGQLASAAEVHAGHKDDATRELAEAEAIKKQNKELQDQLRETTTELEAIKAAHVRQSEEHRRLQDDWSEQLTAAKAAAAKAEDAVNNELAAHRQLELNVVNLRNERHDINARFREEHKAGVKSIRRIKELEDQLRRYAP